MFAKLFQFFVCFFLSILFVVEIERRIKGTHRNEMGIRTIFATSLFHIEVAVPPLCLPTQVPGAVPVEAPELPLSAVICSGPEKR